MSYRNSNKAKVKRILSTLNKWAKHPSLEHDLSDIIDEYHTLVNNGAHNFTDSALFLQSCSKIYEKRVDIMATQFFELSMLLSESCRRPEEEEQPEEEAPEKEPEVIPEPKIILKPEPEKPPEKPKRKRRKKEPPPEKKNLIPGLPKEFFDEILKSLNLTECNINDLIEECLNKLTNTHPLYSVFAKIGDEISRTKNLITVNDISLTGKAWNILYLLENLLNKYKPLPEITNTEIENSNRENSADENDNTRLSAGNTTSQISSVEISNTAMMFTDSGICSAIPDSEASQITSTCTNTITESHYDDNNHDTIIESNIGDETADILPLSNTGNIVPVSNNENTSIIPIQTSDSIQSTNAQKIKINIRDFSINIYRLPPNIITPIKYYDVPAEYQKKYVQKPTEVKLNTFILERSKVQINEIKINLFHFPLDLLKRLRYFQLPTDLKQMNEKQTDHRKRQKSMENNVSRVKKSRNYSLKEFEAFCAFHNSLDDKKSTEAAIETTPTISDPIVSDTQTFLNPDSAVSNPELITVPESITNSELIVNPEPITNSELIENPEPITNSELIANPEPNAIAEPIAVTEPIANPESVPDPDSIPSFPENPMNTDATVPDKVYVDRKSIDQRSDMSYSYPVTPDSGNFSLSHIDENEHLDFISDQEDRGNYSRADSVLMSPHHDNIDSGFSELHTEPEDPTLKKLKEMFPNSFADPTRAEYLKSIVQPPEEQQETENYKEWKSYIDEKTARERDFNIHECGTQILNSFPTKTKDEKVDFGSVVKGKSVGDISRFFVAALQLANTYNVEICDDRIEGEVNSEGFNLKFLSDERPEPELEDLNVPSESMFNASTSFVHSTPHKPRNRSPICRNKILKKQRID